MVTRRVSEGFTASSPTRRVANNPASKTDLPWVGSYYKILIHKNFIDFD